MSLISLIAPCTVAILFGLMKRPFLHTRKLKLVRYFMIISSSYSPGCNVKTTATQLAGGKVLKNAHTLFALSTQKEAFPLRKSLLFQVRMPSEYVQVAYRLLIFLDGTKGAEESPASVEKILPSSPTARIPASPTEYMFDLLQSATPRP